MGLLARVGQTLASAVLVLVANVSLGRSQSYYLVTDVSATLGGTDFMTGQIVRSDGGVYVLELNLGADAFTIAVHRRPDGKWLFVPDSPADPFGPRDVVLFDGVSTSLYFDGNSAGIPDYARIDALFLDSGGNLVFSFDVPVTLGAVEYSQSDLVSFSGGSFSLFWDAKAAGVPLSSNLVGADLDNGGTLIVSFDVPTTLGVTEFVPGQLVKWNGGTSFTSYFADPFWPASAQLRDFSFVPSVPAGRVPDDGCGTPAGVPLTVTRDPGTGNITLSWGASCNIGDNDYAIYEGTLGAYYSHKSRFCTSGGALTRTFTPTLPMDPENAYYIVVSRNAVREGSYGRSSSCVERPIGSLQCESQGVATCP